MKLLQRNSLFSHSDCEWLKGEVDPYLHDQYSSEVVEPLVSTRCSIIDLFEEIIDGLKHFYYFFMRH